MELVEILRTLWGRRIVVAVGAVVALLLALTVLYKPTLPPESRTTTIGAGSTEILIDAPKSTLGDIQRDITSLVSRGGILSRFLVTDEAAQGIGRESGLPARDITVAGAKLSIDGVPDQSAANRAIRLGSSGRYLVQVQQGDDLPLLSIFTEAPTAAEARKLANGTAAALAKSVTDIQAETGVPEKRRLTIRQLGSARSGELTEKPSVVLAFVVFCLAFGAFCLALLAGPWVVMAFRGGARGAGPGGKPAYGQDLVVLDDFSSGFPSSPADPGFVFELLPGPSEDEDEDEDDAHKRSKRTRNGRTSRAKANSG